MTAPVIEVRDLAVRFDGAAGEFAAVDGVSFALEPGRTLGLVGESGCGKSTTALALMGLLPRPAGRISRGEIMFEGADLARLPDAAMRELRGDRMAMIFQEPMTSLNPVFTVGDQIVEAIVRHLAMSRTDARARALEMLRRVRIPSPEQRFGDYPHRLSGGMRQRVMIAMALACAPRLLIADEPTTALDVTIQAQILDLLRALREATGTAILLITHDLGVIAELADEVAVMYAGRIVEHAPAAALFAAPQHPYTIGLLGALPRLDLTQERLTVIRGQVPLAPGGVSGCRFAARCPFVQDPCRSSEPPLLEVGAGHHAACLRAPLPVPALAREAA